MTELRIGNRVLKNNTMIAIAVMSFVAIFFFNAPFPVLVIVAGTIGFIGGRIAPERFVVIKGHQKSSAAADGTHDIDVELNSIRPSWFRSLRICCVFLPLWFLPLVLLKSDARPVACAVAVLAFLLTFRWKRGMATTLAVCCAVGAVLFELM